MTDGTNTPDRHILITREEDVVLARQEGRALAKALGFSLVDQSRITTAISEMTRNVIRYAKSGEMILRYLPPASGRQRGGLEAVISDKGPGISDMDLAMRDGFTTGDGLGMGLPGTRRLMDDFILESTVGVGTTVTIRKWLV